MDKKLILIVALVTSVVLLSLFLLKVPAVVTVTDTIKELGAFAGPDIYQKTHFYEESILSCPKVYVADATTNSSTTYYLVASTTFTNGLGYSTILATSSKPTICP